MCCKIVDINLDEYDIKILGQVPKDKTDKIESFIEGGELHYKLSPPCPFLESGKCTVYDRRPTMCRLFPFNLTTMPDALLLFPCDMRANIFEDYIEYSDHMLKQPFPAKTIDAFEQLHCSFDSKLNEGLPIPMLVMKINDLIPFNEYFKSRLK
uniref:YkgJ family cysteine cluster protein n=1 Tax=Methanolobus sp. ZRKC5 TaxID=3136295 RepID=UPI00406C957E